MQQPKKVLLTGAAGFLGREVRRQLKFLGIACTGIDNFEAGCGASPEAGFLDIADVTDIRSIVHDNFTHIIHLAAIGRNLTCEANPYRAFQVNVGGTMNMLELAHRWGCEFIFCSSNIVLSDQQTVYRMTKRTAEELVQIYANHGTKAMILRPSNIAGPGQSRTEYQPCSFAQMDKTFDEKGYIEITGDGTQQRDYIHVSDVARAFVLALDSNVPGATLDICTGNSISLLEVMRLLGVEYRLVDARPGDAKNLISDHRPAANTLKFKAQTSLNSTITDSFPAVMNAKALHPHK